tara:strand:+ start:379 stop:492 length:114 start_codon:yes stop_codon:yes gene_type:complete
LTPKEKKKTTIRLNILFFVHEKNKLKEAWIDLLPVVA